MTWAVSGGTGHQQPRRLADAQSHAKLAAGDTLVVVAIDRIGRRWMDTVNAVRDLRDQGGQDQVPGPVRGHLGHLPGR